MTQFTFENASLRIFYETGIDQQGNPILSSKTYQNVRESVSANQILAVAEAINSLSKYPVSIAKVVKIDSIEL